MDLSLPLDYTTPRRGFTIACLKRKGPPRGEPFYWFCLVFGIQPSIMMTFFSGTLRASAFGTFRLSTPFSKRAVMSCSVSVSPT